MSAAGEGGGNPFGWDLDELEAWAASLGYPRYRGRQVARWVFSRRVSDPAVMTDLPPELRSRLAADHPPWLPVVKRRANSMDGTVKYLLALGDGEEVEMVIIPAGRRLTLCCSTQVGCAIGCRFCRTGAGGLVRNLTAAEIVGQVVLAEQLVAPGARLSNLVIMGMGEPLLNYAALVKAIGIVTAPWGLGISARRITVSTAGVLPRLAALRSRFPDLNLALSLNAPEQPLREELMPGTRAWPLPELLAALRRLPGGSRHPLTIEYVLLRGINDQPHHARQLAALLKGTGWQVNVIPCNPGDDTGLQPPPEAEIDGFARLLNDAGIRVTVRRSRGSDIAAACGQLRAAGDHPDCKVAEKPG